MKNVTLVMYLFHGHGIDDSASHRQDCPLQGKDSRRLSLPEYKERNFFSNFSPLGLV